MKIKLVVHSLTIVKGNALKQQISKVYLQILSRDATSHIYISFYLFSIRNSIQPYEN